MRISCNGCRVLRKGCTDDCSIRPCLNWITSPQSQANATLFLAKSYGRGGLTNLINSGPENLRPEIFKSLLYEACGRIVNPIHGCTGLLTSGKWHLCLAAVEATLNGEPITKLFSDDVGPPIKAYDIRHVSKKESSSIASEQRLHKVNSRTRFKRSDKMKPRVNPGTVIGSGTSTEFGGPELSRDVESDSVSVETVEETMVKSDEQQDEGNDVDLELRL